MDARGEVQFSVYCLLEDTADFLLAPAERFGQGFFFMLFKLILGLFWCSVVTSVNFSSNLGILENNPKISKKKNIYK